MPASFAHTGLINAIVGLPILCLISTYCVHLLVKSSQQLEGKSKGLSFKYASLAKHSFKSGPNWMRSFSRPMCLMVDGTLLIAQIGVCCVYLVFVTDNITSVSLPICSYKREDLIEKQLMTLFRQNLNPDCRLLQYSCKQNYSICGNISHSSTVKLYQNSKTTRCRISLRKSTSGSWYIAYLGVFN